MSVEALRRAVAIAGGQAALAKAIGTSQTVVWYWLNRAGRCKAEFAGDIERFTGVTKQELRPDLFGGEK